MTHPSQHVLSAEQPSFTELREQFREEARRNLQAKLRADELVLKDAAGNVVKRIVTGLKTDAPAGQDYRNLGEYLAGGGAIPDLENMSDAFTIPDSKGLQKELCDLDRDTQLLVESERVKHPEAESMEGPPLKDTSDEAVLEYMDNLLERE